MINYESFSVIDDVVFSSFSDRHVISREFKKTNGRFSWRRYFYPESDCIYWDMFRIRRDGKEFRIRLTFSRFEVLSARFPESMIAKQLWRARKQLMVEAS